MIINISYSKIASFTDLMKIIQTALYSAWGVDKVTFVSAYPKVQSMEETVTPIITYQVISKRPGSFNKVSEIKPRVRDTLEVTDENDETLKYGVELWGQMFDYEIEFEIWAGSGEEADKAVEDFQKFMFKYTGYLKKLGVNELIFQEQTSKNTGNLWRTDLVNRSLTYMIRLDEVSGVRCPSIEDVIIERYIHDTTFDMELDILTRE